MKPSIGRIVHFVENGIHFAAIVTKIWSDTCINLYVFDDGSGNLSSNTKTSVVYYEDASQDYTWHWPEKV